MDEFMFPDDSRKNESLILYKLTILYMLNILKLPLSNSQLSEFMLEHDLAAYFTIQQSIAELLDGGLIIEEKVHHTTYFSLSKKGEQTLLYYEKLIPEEIIDTIKLYATENKLEIKQQLSVVSTYEPIAANEYVVHCTIKEKNVPIFELNINSPDKEISEKMCDNWKKKHSQIFENIMRELLS